LLNSQTTGEAPQLSSTYGQYDNGANIFLSYFNGNTNPSSFTVSPGFTLAQATGVTMPNGETGNAIQVTGSYYVSPYDYIPFVYNNGYTLQSSIVEGSAKLYSNIGVAQGIAGLITSTAIATASGIGVTM